VRQFVEDSMAGDYFGRTQLRQNKVKGFREFLFTSLADPGARRELRVLEVKLRPDRLTVSDTASRARRRYRHAGRLQKAKLEG
jgi:hypothetical protein